MTSRAGPCRKAATSRLCSKTSMSSLPEASRCIQAPRCGLAAEVVGVRIAPDDQEVRVGQILRPLDGLHTSGRPSVQQRSRPAGFVVQGDLQRAGLRSLRSMVWEYLHGFISSCRCGGIGLYYVGRPRCPGGSASWPGASVAVSDSPHLRARVHGRVRRIQTAGTLSRLAGQRQLVRRDTVLSSSFTSYATCAWPRRGRSPGPPAYADLVSPAVYAWSGQVNCPGTLTDVAQEGQKRPGRALLQAVVDSSNAGPGFGISVVWRLTMPLVSLLTVCHRARLLELFKRHIKARRR